MGICFLSEGGRKDKIHIDKDKDEDIKNIEENLLKEKDSKQIENDKSSLDFNILKEKKEEFENKFYELKKEIKDKQNYYNEIQLFVEKIKTEMSQENQLDLIYMNYNNIIKQQKLKENIKKDIFGEIKNIEFFLDTIANNKQNEIESLYKIIEENLLNLEIQKQNSEIHLSNLENKINNLDVLLKNLETKNNELKIDYYPNNKIQLEQIKKTINNKLIEYKLVKNKFDEIFSYIKKEPKIDEKYLNNSMLLHYPEIENNYKEIINPKNNSQDLLINNFIETCYIYDEFDLYDRNYEYQAVGLSNRVFLEVNEINFFKDRIIKIIDFTIDNKNVKYTYKNSKLTFETIKLKNLEIKNIHLKYKQSKILTEGQKRQRKIYREDEYGITKNLRGRNALFNLIIKNDMEIISFDEPIFKKIKEDEYKLEGLIPKEGKITRVILSKKIAKYKVYYKKRIETKNKNNIKDITLTLHYYFEEGGNKNNDIKINRTTNPQNNITKISKENRQYKIEFNNIKQKFAEVKIEIDLINICKGDWLCDLTEEQIEKLIPKDYKTNKKKLKHIATNIIKTYDEKHKNDLAKITDISKIGKWIKSNIVYNENYKEEKQITALEIYQNKIGVCKQFTILYNALLYSLGYKCIYISGFAFKDNDNFNLSDAHCWSLVRVNGKWLPFDATWGIFSGKLPACHVFEDFFLKKNISSSIEKDNLKHLDEVYGKFIE